jgi:transposase
MRIIGIDLGKREAEYAEVNAAGQRIGGVRFTADVDGFTSLFSISDAGGTLDEARRAKILVEAGTTTRWVAPLLRVFGHMVVVADPNYQPMYVDHRSKRKKTDKRDALTLAVAMLKENFRESHERSEAEFVRVSNVYARARLVRTRSRHCAAVRNSFLGFGVILKRCEPAKLPDAAMKQLSRVPASAHLAIKTEVEAVAFLNRKIARLDARLEREATGDKRIRRLCTIPGVGPVTATTFVAVVDEPKRFRNGHELASHLGLVPSVSSSGDKHHVGGITKMGPKYLRTSLVKASWGTWKSKTAESARLRAWARRIAKKHGSKKLAVVALARKMAGVMLSMWKSEQDFRGPTAEEALLLE